MFKNFQPITLFQRVNDNEIQSSVIEVEGENVANNYISCPMNASDSLGNEFFIDYSPY